MLNEQLIELYSKNLDGLKKMYFELDKQKISNYVGPLLIYCWEERYLNSQCKLVVIGQETNGWYSNYVTNSEALYEDVSLYRNFRLGEHNGNSPFWRYVHEFNFRINGVDG